MPRPPRGSTRWTMVAIGGVVVTLLGLAAFVVSQVGWGPARPAEAQPTSGSVSIRAASLVGASLAGAGLAPSAPAAAIPVAGAGPQATVSVVTVPAVKTFVYLNGGSLLGEAPLKDAAIPAGKQTLTFWAPSISGRSTRVVDVEAGGKAVVIENLQGKTTFASARVE